jgi:peptidoglycan/LPS O-acetylase OafA/YrhL
VTGPKHLELLDQVRGVAILAVLAIHTLGLAIGFGDLPWGEWFRTFSVPWWVYWFLPLGIGNVGVPIFFVVSGFCIHLSFQQQGRKWGSFFLRRFFRIYPAYFMALVFSILLIYANSTNALFTTREFWIQLLSHLFLVHNFGSATVFGINGPFWSLAVEAQLYLVYPVLLLLVARLGWRRTMVILAILEISARGADGVIRGTDNIVQAMGGIHTMAGHVSWVFACSPVGYWFSWALGAFVADAFLKQEPLPFLNSRTIPWLALAVASYFVKPLNPFRFLLFAVVTAVVLGKLLSGRGAVVRPPSVPLKCLGKIGVWSYSLYLLHEPLLQAGTNVMIACVPIEYRAMPMVAFMFTLSTWLAVIPAGVLWYYLFERPGIALGKRLVQKAEGHGNPNVETIPSTERINSRRLSPAFGLTIGIGLAVIVSSYWVVTHFTPMPPEISNNLAWSYATDPDPAKRNGALAVKLAESACRQTQYHQIVMVGTLAAAYAEAGRFDEAIATAQKACAMAGAAGDQQLLQNNQMQLELFLQHQPYHQTQTQP